MSLPYIYTPDTPQGFQQINNTQGPVNFNFQDISTLMAVNHVPFNTANDFGKHNFITYYNQSSEPSTGPTDIAIFSENTGNGLQLYYRYPNNGNIYALSSTSPQPAASTSSTTQPTAGTGGINVASGYSSTGYFYLNGGILCMMQAFTTPFNAVTSGTYAFEWTMSDPQTGANVNFKYPPFFMNVGMGYKQPSPNVPAKSGIVDIQATSNTEFNVTFVNGGGGMFYVMAIGI